MIRAILSGISRPSAPAGTVWGSSGSAQLVEGAVRLASIDDALPDVVARAEHTRVPFTLVLARPGPSATPGNPAPAPSAADTEDLAAALSVSLSPVQDLYDAGRGHLAVIVPGRSGAGQREAMRLTRRAAAQGSPLFTWAAARYPRDASTAAGLVEVAVNRLDGRLVSRIDAAAARTPERGTGRYGAAIWAGVAAAVLLGAVAFALHGSGPSTQTATGTLSSGQPGTSTGGSGSSGGPGSGSTGSGASSSGSSGSSGSGSSTGSGASVSGSTGSGSTGSGAATGSSASGTTGTPGTPQAGTNQTQPGLLSTPTTLPSTGTLLGGTGTTGTGGSLGTGTGTGTGTSTGSTGSTGSGSTGSGSTGSGSSGTTTTTTTTAPSSTSSQCTGLVNSLTCTANNLLGGLGL